MDAIQPEPVSAVAHDRRSSLSSSHDKFDDKKSPPVDQYDLDPEKVGSIRRDADEEDDDEEPTFWRKVHAKYIQPHWRIIKIFLWVAVFMTMTALVMPWLA